MSAFKKLQKRKHTIELARALEDSDIEEAEQKRQKLVDESESSQSANDQHEEEELESEQSV